MRIRPEAPISMLVLASATADRVKRQRAKTPDHQDDGPQDATLMVRKDGVGTITFDTTTGDTWVSGALQPVSLGKIQTMDELRPLVVRKLASLGVKPAAFDDEIVQRQDVVYLWDEPVAALNPRDGTVLFNADNARRGFQKMRDAMGLAPESGGTFKAGSVLKTWVFDGGLSPDTIQAIFREQHAADVAKAKSPYTEDLATVDDLKIFDEVLDGKESAADFVDRNSRKWEWVAAVRFRDDEGREQWMMGGNLAA